MESLPNQTNPEVGQSTNVNTTSDKKNPLKLLLIILLCGIIFTASGFAIGVFYAREISKPMLTGGSQPIPLVINETNPTVEKTNPIDQTSTTTKEINLTTEGIDSKTYTISWKENYKSQEEKDSEYGIPTSTYGVVLESQISGEPIITIREYQGSQSPTFGKNPKISVTSDGAKIVVTSTAMPAEEGTKILAFDTKTGDFTTLENINVAGEKPCSVYGAGQAKIQDNLIMLCGVHASGSKNIYKYDISSGKATLAYTMKATETYGCHPTWDSVEVNKTSTDLVLKLCNVITDANSNEIPFTQVGEVKVPLVK